MYHVYHFSGKIQGRTPPHTMVVDPLAQMVERFFNERRMELGITITRPY